MDSVRRAAVITSSETIAWGFFVASANEKRKKGRNKITNGTISNSEMHLLMWKMTGIYGQWTEGAIELVPLLLELEMDVRSAEKLR